jgi:hypothetical protein
MKVSISVNILSAPFRPSTEDRENFILQVFPAAQCSTLFSLATDFSNAVGPVLSAPWHAPTPSTSGAPESLPSGDAPVMYPEWTWPLTGHMPQV